MSNGGCLSLDVLMLQAGCFRAEAALERGSTSSVWLVERQCEYSLVQIGCRVSAFVNMQRFGIRHPFASNQSSSKMNASHKPSAMTTRCASACVVAATTATRRRAKRADIRGINHVSIDHVDVTTHGIRKADHELRLRRKNMAATSRRPNFVYPVRVALLSVIVMSTCCIQHSESFCHAYYQPLAGNVFPGCQKSARSGRPIRQLVSSAPPSFGRHFRSAARAMSTETSSDKDIKHDQTQMETQVNDRISDNLQSEIAEAVPDGDSDGTSLWGLASLVTVPLVWGTYVPAVRFIYENHVPGFVFSASYHCVSTLTSLAILMVNRERSDKKATSRLDASSSHQSKGTVGAHLDSKDDMGDESSMAVALRGGFELGMYTFLASSLQVVGLETVPSDRAGFLIQLTTIMVPIVQATMDRDFRSVPKTTWIGCLVALAGVVVMGLDPTTLSNLSAESLHLVFTRGDAFIVAAALLYTLHVVKLGYWAKRTTPLKLSTAKSMVQTTLSLCFVAALAFAASSVPGQGLEALQTGLAASALAKGREVVQFIASVANQFSTGQMAVPSWGKVVATILWCGTVGNAYVLYAQSYGQRFVRPSDANLVYSLQPIFTATFAYWFLGETMGATGLVGGALILLAVSLVATETLSGRSSRPDPESPP